MRAVKVYTLHLVLCYILCIGARASLFASTRTASIGRTHTHTHTRVHMHTHTHAHIYKRNISLLLSSFFFRTPLKNTSGWIVEKMLREGRDYIFSVSEQLIPNMLKKVIKIIPTDERRLFIAGSFPSSFFDPEKDHRQCQDLDLFAYCSSLEQAVSILRLTDNNK